MKLEINYSCLQDQYYATIFDGPDGVDEETFVGSSLGEIFEKVVKWRTRISLSYLEATEND